MEGYPRNLTEFEARFSTERACREYFGPASVAGWFSLSTMRGAEGVVGE